jgi:hypothetical protein
MTSKPIDIATIGQQVLEDIDKAISKDQTIAEGMRKGVQLYYDRLKQAIADSQSDGQAEEATTESKQDSKPKATRSRRKSKPTN